MGLKPYCRGMLCRSEMCLYRARSQRGRVNYRHFSFLARCRIVGLRPASVPVPFQPASRRDAAEGHLDPVRVRRDQASECAYRMRRQLAGVGSGVSPRATLGTKWATADKFQRATLRSGRNGRANSRTARLGDSHSPVSCSRPSGKTFSSFTTILEKSFHRGALSFARSRAGNLSKRVFSGSEIATAAMGDAPLCEAENRTIHPN